MKNYVGEKHWQMKVVGNGEIVTYKGGRRLRKVDCRCSCGNTKRVLYQGLKRGDTKSCGCYAKEQKVKQLTTHGMYGSRPNKLWIAMKARCNNPNVKFYKRYGGRGIKVCDRWNKFENFWEDMKEGYSDELTIDRIDNNGDYCKENCKWSTYKEQANNRRNNRVITVDCITKTLMQWAEATGEKRQTIQSRVKRGMSWEESVMIAINKNFRKNCILIK